MEEQMHKTRERLEKEFKEISSCEKWTTDILTKMKDVLKSMYYIDVISAMKEGGEYPGSEEMANYRTFDSMSGAQRRNAMGQFSKNGMSGTYPMNGYYPMNTFDRGYYDGDRNGGMSGRRYYDSEKDHAIQELRRKIDELEAR